MEEKIKKIKATEALDWFRENICAKKCLNAGIKRLNCYEKMRKIITGFENHPVTRGQFVYSMRVKNKICDLTDEEFKEGGEKNEDQKKTEQQEKNYSTQLENRECEICGNAFIPTKPSHWICTECFLERYHFLGEYSSDLNWKKWKVPGEPEHWFICYECGEYFEERPYWIRLPEGWRPFCRNCSEVFGPEYDKDGAEIGEEWNHQYEYGTDPDFGSGGWEGNKEEEKIWERMDKKLKRKTEK